MGVGAAGATSVACVVLVSNMIYDGAQRGEVTTVKHSSPSFTYFFMALGTISYAFGGHPAFPTFQTDMKNQKKFGRAVFLAYMSKFSNCPDPRDILIKTFLTTSNCTLQRA